MKMRRMHTYLVPDPFRSPPEGQQNAVRYEMN
jgi:hypothetical protein